MPIFLHTHYRSPFSDLTINCLLVRMYSGALAFTMCWNNDPHCEYRQLTMAHLYICLVFGRNVWHVLAEETQIYISMAQRPRQTTHSALSPVAIPHSNTEPGTQWWTASALPTELNCQLGKRLKF